MPGWHAETKALVAQRKLRLVGVVEEQHPDRARLFMQYKQMDFPVAVDALSLLGVRVVPLVVAVDQHGIVRYINPTTEEVVRDFIDRDYPEPEATPPAELTTASLDALRAAAGQGGARAWRRLGDALFLWHVGHLEEAIAAYERAVQSEPSDAAAHFRLGVAYRRRYDAGSGALDDFTRAVVHWQGALDLDANNYIWRRRIQQYGPRLDKPYPFYDWIEAARSEIRARGHTPVKLAVEPTGAELADPKAQADLLEPVAEEPDPQAKIDRDEGFVDATVTLVPPGIEPGQTARVHVVFKPVATRKAHWNNEADDLVVWINPPPGLSVDRPYLRVPRPEQPISDEPRRLEFEITTSGSLNERVIVPAYALYYVCEDVRGTCLYRRKDLAIELPVSPRPRQP